MNSNIRNKAIAITRASSGIGEAIARHLAAQGQRSNVLVSGNGLSNMGRTLSILLCRKSIVAQLTKYWEASQRRAKSSVSI